MNPTSNPNKTALVLGATGGVGGAIASALQRHGWQVRGMARNIAQAAALVPSQPIQREGKLQGQSAIEWISGDAMNASDVERAAQGASTIVHAVNPPGYRHWERLVLPMIDNTIAAARASGGARVVLPGTVYNFDPATTPVIRADAPQQATSRKGRVRQEMEKRLAQAAPEVPSLILRAGDFFGPGARSSWFAQAMVKPGQPVKRLTNVAQGPGHSWAYLPDLAETFARLLDDPSQLQPFERLQFQGLYDASGEELIESLRRVTGRALPVRGFPWWLMKALGPIVGGFPREVAEIAPYWKHPMRLDNARLVQLLGAEPATLLDEALRAALSAMNCLDSNEKVEEKNPLAA